MQTGLGHAGLGHVASIPSCSLSISAGVQSTQRLLDLVRGAPLAGGISGEASVRWAGAALIWSIHLSLMTWVGPALPDFKAVTASLASSTFFGILALLAS